MATGTANSSRPFIQIALLGVIWGAAAATLVTRGKAKQTVAIGPIVAGVVDISRVSLGHCSLVMASFRSRDEGWVTDSCGKAFHSIDGGLSFEQLPAGGNSLAVREDGTYDLAAGQVNRIEWLSERRAIAFGSKEALAMATSDGGVSWQRLGLPVSQGEELNASDHSGQMVWACGRSGTIFRSSDGGDSFAATKHTPFTKVSCTALSFVDASRGWAGGDDGALYETSDGGDSWNRLPAPFAAPDPSDWARPRVGNVLRVSADEGWVSIVERSPVWRTRTFAMRRFSREWSESAAPVSIAERLAGTGRWGDDGTVTLRGNRLIFRVGEQLVRETPLVGAAPPARQIIRGREPLEPGHTVVWTDNAIVETFDDGRSWSTFVSATDLQVGDRPWTPGRDRIWRVVHPRPGKQWGGPLVELGDGTVLRELGRAFVLSEQPEFDRFTIDMIEAHRRGDPTPPGPLDCLATSASGRITFEIIHNGDCHASKHEAKLSWGPQGASLDPWVGASSPITLTNDQRIDLVRAIADAAHRPDDTRHGSNDHLSVVLEARCGEGPPIRGRFEQSDTGEPGTPYLIEQELIRHMRAANERKKNLVP